MEGYKIKQNASEFPSLHLSDIDVVVSFEKLVGIVEKANKAILDIYHQDETEWNLEFKNGHEPLTLADKKANEIICSGLKSLFGDKIPIISEEKANDPWDIRKNYHYCWLVDPLDGTKEFLKRNGQFTVNIGLCRKNECILGVVSIPVDGCIYFGAESIGSFKMMPKQVLQKIKVRIVSKEQKNLVIMTSSSHSSEKTQEFLKKLDDPIIQRCGSSIKILLLAEGKADIYPRFVPTSEWDTCAAHAILKNAGGEILQVSGGEPAADGFPLTYNKEDILNPFFVAFGGVEELQNGNANDLIQISSHAAGRKVIV